MIEKWRKINDLAKNSIFRRNETSRLIFILLQKKNVGNKRKRFWGLRIDFYLNAFRFRLNRNTRLKD